jgi:long-chain acyl-CoA synthetase
VLLTHPAVRRLRSWTAQAERGEAAIAFVVRRGDADVSEADLDRPCLDDIARFKRPKIYGSLLHCRRTTRFSD